MWVFRPWEIYNLFWLSHRQPTSGLTAMSDSPPCRIPNQPSPTHLRSALKHGDPSRSRPSPPTSPPLPTPPVSIPGRVTLSTPLSSPSPVTTAGGYTPKVSFDTFENPAASMFSFTLSAESVGYTRSPHTRVFLCAASPDESGRQALDWALDSLVQDGDELVVFRGFDEDDLGVSLFHSFRRSRCERYRSPLPIGRVLILDRPAISQRSRCDPGRSS